MSEHKSTGILLRIAGVLALLVAVSQTAFYFYASSHLKEILQNGSIKLFHNLITVTESAALFNPEITTAIFCVLLSAACFIGAHFMRSSKK